LDGTVWMNGRRLAWRDGEARMPNLFPDRRRPKTVGTNYELHSTRGNGISKCERLPCAERVRLRRRGRISIAANHLPGAKAQRSIAGSSGTAEERAEKWETWGELKGKHTSTAKAGHHPAALTARVNSCPDTRCGSARVLQQAVKPCPSKTASVRENQLQMRLVRHSTWFLNVIVDQLPYYFQ